MAWFLALALALGAVGWTIEHLMRSEIRAQAIGRLGALADLKVDQIAAWRGERLADAAAIAAPPVDPSDLARLARGAPPRTIAAWYRAIRERHAYADLLVVSSRGEALFSAAGLAGPLDPVTAEVAAQALQQRRAVLSDLHRSARDGRVYLDAAAPIPAAGGEGAALVLRTDAETLFPLLQAWPAGGPTVETVLVRRDGEDVLFLNEPRHARGAALALRIPLSRGGMLAAQAAAGATGTREGLDYRGVHALAEIRAVPDSPWRLVAKVDHDEVFATERRLAWAAWAAMAAFLALGALVARTWWRAEKRIRFAAEQASLDEALRYRAEVLANVSDAVISTDADTRVTSWNRAAERVYGFTEAEALGRRVPDLLRTEYLPGASREWMLAELDRHGRVALTVRQHRKDGAAIEVEATLATRRAADGTFLGYSGVNRDVTERRRAEAELKQASDRLAVANRMASVGTLAAG
ncbi:MAG TPA: PAS domain S-box protein, partial [Anaeromyxobacter sp.]